MGVDPTNKWRMASVKTSLQCSLGVVSLGFVMLLAGAIICGIAFTEVRPNVADENYERYIRSDVKRVVGPIALAFGLLCIIAGCLFFGCNLCAAHMEKAKYENNKLKYNVRASEEHLPSTPDVEKKMLSDV
ncbi:hypothetical protein X975_17336, partial [Stegodyphus mimosarum]